MENYTEMEIKELQLYATYEPFTHNVEWKM